jgi:hypothetical protein
VRALQVRDVEDLHGLEVAEIDHCDPAVGPVVDVEEPAVVVAVRLGQRRMVGVPPAQRIVLVGIGAVVEHLHRPVGTESVAGPGIGANTGMVLSRRIEGTPITCI